MLEEDTWINKDSRDQWVFLNARDTYHRVTEVKDNRLSVVIYHTPQHLHRLDKEDWESLRESGFPVDAFWELGLSPPEEDEPDEEVEEVFQTICESITMTSQVTPGLEDVKDQEFSTSTFPDSAVQLGGMRRHIESAEKGRRCEICHLQLEGETFCPSCSTTLVNLQEIQSSQGYGNSLVHVLTSLQKWAKDLPGWELIHGMELLTKPVNQRFTRIEKQRITPFIVIEGPDSVGKTFHSEGISLWLSKQGLLFRV